MIFFKKKKYVCSRCMKEISEDKSRKFSGEIYCIECELYVSINGTEKAQEEKRLKIINEAKKSTFHYNIDDPVDAYTFWDSEVNAAHRILKSQEKSWTEIMNGFECQKIIPVKSTPDYEYPNQSDWDWDIHVWIYYNDENGIYKFALTESYNSEWDGFPVFRGGEISLELFEKYMKIMDNHEYDELISKLKNYH